MSLSEIPVTSLVGGVSQQPPANRLPNQVGAMVNAFPAAVTGLAKRPPTQQLARVIDEFTTVTLAHTINRDAVERYKLIFDPQQVRAYDLLSGVELPVVPASGGFEYIDPRTPNLLDDGDGMRSGGFGWTAASADVADTSTDPTPPQGPLGFDLDVSADKLTRVGNTAIATSSSQYYQTAGTWAAEGDFQVFSVYMKQYDTLPADEVRVGFRDATNGINHWVKFSITAGVFAYDSSAAGMNWSVEDVGRDGWYRLAIWADAADLGTTTSGDTLRCQIRWNASGPFPDKQTWVFGALFTQGNSADVPPYIIEDRDPVKAITVADTTFLVNTNVTVAAETSSGDNTIKDTAYFFVKTGGILDVDYQVDLRVTGGSDETGTHTTPSTGTTGLQTDTDIANALLVLVQAFAGATGITCTRFGSVVEVVADGGEVIERLDVSDSRGDSTMVAFREEISKFTDLPLICRDGHTVKVVGDPERDADDYYVKFVADDQVTANAFGKGKWEETISLEDLSHGYDNTTMPHKMTRLQDDAVGTITGIPNRIYFEYDRITWDDRLVGDDLSNPIGSFVGEVINDVFFFRNRLGFLAKDIVALSESGSFFNFWRNTVLDLVDTDVIDVTTGGKDIEDLRAAVEISEELLIFSDRSQHVLVGEPTLTPASARIIRTKSFPSLSTADAVSDGRGVLFADKRGDFSGLLQVNRQGDSLNFDVEDLAIQAPQYVEGRIRLIAHGRQEELTLCLQDSDRSKVYTHKTLWDTASRLQSAWNVWDFGTNAEVVEAAWIDSTIHFTIVREDGVHLEKMVVDTEQRDPGLDWITYLDRRLDDTQLTSAVYSGGSDTTVLTLPYDIEAGETMVVVDMASGLIVPQTASTTTTITVQGDFSSADLFVGQTYEMSVTLTEPVVRDPRPDGGFTPRLGRNIEVGYLVVGFADSASFDVDVTADERTTTTETYTGPSLGTGEFGQGSLVLSTDEERFAVIGNSRQIEVTIRNDGPFPCNFTALRWEVRYHQRAPIL